MRPPPLLIYGKPGPQELCYLPPAHKLRSKLPTSSVQFQASSLQNLIATADPARLMRPGWGCGTRIGIQSPPQAEEPKELSSGQNWKPKIILGTEAKKRPARQLSGGLIATVPHSKFELSRTKFTIYENSNRNKMRRFRNSLVLLGDFSLGLTGATALCYLSGPSDPSSPPLRLNGGIE
jgi:hypothetical protein